MCGIVGYFGDKDALEVILNGLKRLEYRGYDSAGVALLGDGQIDVRKEAGKIKILEDSLNDKPVSGVQGIGHTRWATHGIPNQANAHPHTDSSGRIAIVHNGIIENYQELKDQLVTEGHTFRSDTDSEVIAAMIARELHQANAAADARDPYDPLIHAVQSVLVQLHGTYGLVVLFRDWPDALIAARLGSRLEEAIGLLESRRLSELPVIDEAGRLHGLLDIVDLVGVDPSAAETSSEGQPAIGTAA